MVAVRVATAAVETVAMARVTAAASVAAIMHFDLPRTGICWERTVEVATAMATVLMARAANKEMVVRRRRAMKSLPPPAR